MDNQNTNAPTGSSASPGSRLVTVRDIDNDIYYGWAIYVDGEYVRYRLRWIAEALGLALHRYATDASINDAVAQRIINHHGRSVTIPSANKND